MHIFEMILVVSTIIAFIFCIAGAFVNKDLQKMQAFGIAMLLNTNSYFQLGAAVIFCSLYFVVLYCAHLHIAFWTGIVMTVTSYGQLFYSYYKNKDIVEIYKAQLS